MKKRKILTAAIAVLLTVTPFLSISGSKAQAASPAGKIVLKKQVDHSGIYVYGRNGKQLLTQQVINGRKWTVGVNVKSGATLSYYGQPVIIRGPKKQNAWLTGKKFGSHYEPAAYVQIGNNRYIHSENVSTMNGKGVLVLSHNAAVYDRHGQRVSYQGKRIIPKYMLINYAGKAHATKRRDRYYYAANFSGSKEKSLRTYTIRGRQYFAIGGGKYINANNVNLMNGHSLYRKGGTATATARTKLTIYNYLMQKRGSIPAGRKVKVDSTKTTGDGDNTSLFFRLAGTRGKKTKYIYWGDWGQYGYDTGGITDEFQGNFALSVRLEG